MKIINNNKNTPNMLLWDVHGIKIIVINFYISAICLVKYHLVLLGCTPELYLVLLLRILRVPFQDTIV